MNLKNIINEQYFKDDIDIYCFKELLKTYWCFNLEIISKPDFLKLRWKILKQENNITTICIYPEMTFLDILQVLDVLEKRLDKDILSWYDYILLKSKIKILQILKNPETNKELEEILKTQKISKRLIDRILSQKLVLSKSREIIKSQDKDKFEINDLKKNIWDEFQIMLFRLWIKNLINNLESFSKKDYDIFMEEISNNHHLQDKWDNVFKYDISQEILIYFRNTKFFLQEESKKLKEQIWISEYKKHIKKAKKTNNLKYLQETQHEVVTNILKEILNFPFTNVNQKNWYKISKIISTKQAYCVWFCMIAHWLFKELWIKHNALIKDNHILLEIYIWENSYYFETTSKNFWLPKILKKELIDENNYKYYLDNNSTENVVVWDAEKSLLSSILNNNSMELNSLESRNRQLEKSWEINFFKANTYTNISNNLISNLNSNSSPSEILEILDKALELSPNYIQAIFLKSEVYTSLKLYQKSLEELDKIIEIDFFNIQAYYKKYYVNILLWNHKKGHLFNFVIDLLSLEEQDIIIDDEYKKEKEILLKLKKNWLEMLFNIIIENM